MCGNPDSSHDATGALEHTAEQLHDATTDQLYDEKGLIDGLDNGSISPQAGFLKPHFRKLDFSRLTIFMTVTRIMINAGNITVSDQARITQQLPVQHSLS